MTKSTIEQWMPVLGWQSCPNFGLCHTLPDYDEFTMEYYCSAELRMTRDNLLFTLAGGYYEQLNKRILGQPGSGKTTFIYSLERGAREGHVPALQKMFFRIIHLNRTDTPLYKQVIQEEMLRAWAGFFLSCGHSDIAEKINRSRQENRVKLNQFMDYYKQNKKAFGRLLTIIIDDVDILPGEHVAEVAKAIIATAEMSSVKKWIVIRESTYTGYDHDTESVVNAFFPEQVILPSVSLFKIADHRIKARNGPSAKNPFLPVLCDNVLKRVFGGSIREGLASLDNILTSTNIGEIDVNTSVDFIRMHIARTAVRALVKGNKLPNLHDPRLRDIYFPFPLDIVKFCTYVNDKKRLLNLVNMAATERARRAGVINKSEYTTERLGVGVASIQYSVDMLVDAGIIIEDKRKRLRLSDRGAVVGTYVGQEFYSDACKEMVGDLPDADWTTYWKMANTKIDYEQYVASSLVFGK